MNPRHLAGQRLQAGGPVRYAAAVAGACTLLAWSAAPSLAQSCPVTTMAELRAAIGNPACSTLDIAPGTYLLTSSGSGELVIGRGMNIQNTGGGRVVVDAGGASRVFFIKDAGAPIAMEGLTIQGANVDGHGAGLYIEASDVTITSTTINGNVNPTSGSLGAGMFTKKSTVVLENVTVSGNSAAGGGGGLYQEDGTVTLRNVTVAGNGSAVSGGGIYAKKGTLILDNTIVADNTQGSGDQLVNDANTFTSNGHNLVEGGCSGCLPGDLTTDPNLGALADNGGNTYTHALPAGSPAINAGLDIDAPATDQRGVARPQGAASDIGSFELEATPLPLLSSAGDQTFWVDKAPTAISSMTVIEAGTAASITAADDIRIRIPAGFNMTWDAADLTATISGNAAGKASTAVSYEDTDQTLVIDVTSDFAPGDTIVVSELSFLDFTDASGADNLELEVDNAGTVAAEDDKTIEILANGTPTISSELDQSFRVGDPPISISTITVREDATAPSITAGNDIRVRIPSGFNMSWDVTDVDAQILGTAAGKVSSTVSYEDGEKTLVIDVLTDFEPGELITISGLSFTNFTAPSLDDNLELEVRNDGGVSASDDKVIFIVLILVTPDIHSSRDQFFTVGDPSTSIAPIRVTDDDVIPQITAANDIRITIPADLDMVWDVTDLSAQIGAKANQKVSSAVSYEDGGKTLVLDVITDFEARDWITLRDLSFTSFSSAGAPDRLMLLVDGGSTVVSVDAFIKEIRGSVISVDVWPDTVSASRLPSNGTNYTADFTVSNIGSGTDSYDLLTSASPGTAISVISITGTDVTQGANPDSARLSNLAAGDWRVVTVTYSVGDVPVGTIDTLRLTARSVSSPTESDDGRLILTVVRPDLTLTKEVVPNGNQLPGIDLTYTVTATNAGSEEALGVVSMDSLPAEVQFKLGSVSTSFPVGIGVTVEYSNDGGASWTYSPVSEGCGAPVGYDGCVDRIRWVLQDPLPSDAPDNTGDMEFVARIK